MDTHIEIDLHNNNLVISERGCIVEEYSVTEDWPAVIDEICILLHDYLEGI